DTRLVEDEGKIYRFDADADHGDVKPLEGPGWWIAVAAATQNHNNLSNLQGGSATERYHLTKAERDSLVAHLADTNNPHQVTPEQIGAETPAGAQAKVDAHASRTDNPHRVTATQVGAYPAGSKVADSERLNGQPASYYTNIPARLGYTPVNKAGDTLDGQFVHDSDSNKQPFYFSRTGSTSREYMSVGLDDSRVQVVVNNDETTAGIRIKLEATDTESGGGANANSGTIEISTS